MNDLHIIMMGVLLVLFAGFTTANAQIELPSFISDNMVLQQQCDASIWGWADTGDKIVVKGSWDNREFITSADKNGKWTAILKTPEAGGPYTILINDFVINNVMIGEVWICSGQSNMQWAVAQSKNAEAEIAAADYPDIRFFYIAREFSDVPQKNCYGQWEKCTPQTSETFSAAAYFFGRELYKKLNIPIGLIHTSWGGTPAEAWTRKEILKSDQKLNVYIKRFENKIKNHEPGISPRDQNSPAGLYNSMIAPLIPYGIRGAIWYQGEANVKEAELYEILFPKMIQNWRDDWRQGNFPFYFVQLAPFEYDTPLVGALLRDAQRKSLSMPNTGMAVTLDIGNPNDIHPVNKQDVGKRLALWALSKTYGNSDIVCSGPIYNSMNAEKNTIRILFDYAGKGLISKGKTLTHFEIAGKDREFLPAEARIEKNSVVVSNGTIKSPAAVRYAFFNTDEPNLFNSEGLPASSFRTDDWPVITENVIISSKFDPETDEYFVTMRGELAPLDIRYTVDGTKPTINSRLYTGTLKFKNSVVIMARAFLDNLPSVSVSENIFFRHLATGKKIQITHLYSPKYTAGGDYALVNGIRGSDNFHDGNWQGFEQDDLEAVIDLGKIQSIKKISSGYLQSVNSWIFFPRSVEFQISSDKQNWNEVFSASNNVPDNQRGNLIKTFSKTFRDVKARFVRVRAKNIGVCPDWHKSAGGKAWLFVDEIIIK